MSDMKSTHTNSGTWSKKYLFQQTTTMICPKCLVQMHQSINIPKTLDPTFDFVGGGIAEDATYETWELKRCPTCGRLTVEFYGAYWVTSYDDAILLVKQIQKITEK